MSAHGEARCDKMVTARDRASGGGMMVSFKKNNSGIYSQARCFNRLCDSNGGTVGHRVDNRCSWSNNTGKCKNFKGENKIMKVKDVMTEVQADITAERKERVKRLLKEKQLELDAARKVLKKLESDMDALLERDVDDFVFPHETGTLVYYGWYRE